MITRAEFHGLSLAVALVMASAGMLTAEAAVAQEDAAGQAVAAEQLSTAAAPPKADLDRTALRVETVLPAPRPTLASSRGVVLPKILGSYR